MNVHRVICSGCGKETDLEYTAITKSGFVKGHKHCIRHLLNHGTDYLRKFLWHDEKGSYGVGWLNDVRHRKVVEGGEVIRDYGRKYFI